MSRVGKLLLVLVSIGGTANAQNTFSSLRVTGNSRLGGATGSGGWLESLIPGSEGIGQSVSLSTTGTQGLIGGCRTSDSSTTGSQACQGISGFVINNNSIQLQTVYAGYFEARRYNGAGISQAGEHDIINQGSAVPITSYSNLTLGLTTADIYSCGRQDVSYSAACSAALIILNNGKNFQSPFSEGIIFQNKSLANNNRTSIAVDMAQGNSLIWREPASRSVAALIRSDVTVAPASTPAAGGQIIFANDGVHLQNRSTNADILVGSTAGVAVRTGIFSLPTYAYANLPSSTPVGAEVFCTDCLKPGQATGNGTGMPVFADGSGSWFSTAGTVAGH